MQKQECAFWTDWTMWTACSETCGSNATRSRWRKCRNGVAGGLGCEGLPTDVDPCDPIVSCSFCQIYLRQDLTRYFSFSLARGGRHGRTGAHAACFAEAASRRVHGRVWTVYRAKSGAWAQVRKTKAAIIRLTHQTTSLIMLTLKSLNLQY